MLKRYTKYTVDYFNENTPRIKWLWEILEEFSEDDKIKFIKFCYAQERLPSTSEDYEKLQLKFKIKPNMDKNKKDQLIKADTCFFTIELSDYTSKEVMKKKILSAISLDNGLNADNINPDQLNNNANFDNYGR